MICECRCILFEFINLLCLNDSVDQLSLQKIFGKSHSPRNRRAINQGTKERSGYAFEKEVIERLSSVVFVHSILPTMEILLLSMLLFDVIVMRCV